MVDPVSGTGGLQGVSATQRTQGNLDKQKSEQASSLERKDEVRISDEAISQQQAEEAAARVRDELAKKREELLGLDPSFDKDA